MHVAIDLGDVYMLSVAHMRQHSSTVYVGMVVMVVYCNTMENQRWRDTEERIGE